MEETKEKELEISKGAQIAAKWWAESFDGTISCSSRIIESAEQMVKAAAQQDELHKIVTAFVYHLAKQNAEDLEKEEGLYISKEQSEKFRKNLEILLQKSINERGHEWLATDEDRALGVLGLACYLSGIDHENLSSLPLNVMMHVSADKVEVCFEDMEKTETIFDAKREKILSGAKVLSK